MNSFTGFYWLPKIWAVLWKVTVFTLLWGLMTTPFLIPFDAKLQELNKSHPLQTRVYYDLISIVVLVAASWIMMRFVEHRPLIEIGLRAPRSISDFLIGIIGGAIWLAVPLLTLWMFGWLSVQPALKISWVPLLWVSFAMLLNVIAQEILGRGYIFLALESNLTTFWAILISSIIFMLYHFAAFKGAWLPALNVFAAGVLFAVAYKFSNNLWLPIGLHFAWNLLLGPVFGLAISGQNHWSAGWQIFRIQGPTLFTGGIFGIEGGLITLAATIAGIIAIHSLSYRK